ncbi:MAG: hypothetical protein MI921_02680 [Cytophagales bacterium]|nr:hypothetical protein [Cytophagales bacterium]
MSFTRAKIPAIPVFGCLQASHSAAALGDCFVPRYRMTTPGRLPRSAAQQGLLSGHLPLPSRSWLLVRLWSVLEVLGLQPTPRGTGRLRTGKDYGALDSPHVPDG